MDNDQLSVLCRQMREDIVKMCYRLGDNAAHLGGCMSLVELLAVLYTRFLRWDSENPSAEARDRLIMSKGQGSIAMYAAMRIKEGKPDLDEIGDLLGEGNIYYKQSVRNPARGIEFSSGSLGQGLAYGVGIAWAIRKKGNRTSKVYVFCGDGECDEGSVWEAASLAGHLQLDNLIVVVDQNGLQIDGYTRDINCMDRLGERFAAFGFDTVMIDGHNVEQIERAFLQTSNSKPRAIIAKTVKGMGVHFAEDRAEWHQNVLTEELFQQALRDVREGGV